MHIYSGNFGPSLLPIQMTTTQNIVKKIEFFPTRGFTSGAAIYNSGDLLMGLESGALPYLVGSGGRLTIEFATDDLLQDTRNFFLRGSNGDGYYCIVHP